jgi:predicted regulator of Ras-like GTPase activity (Roadblock/LC7/MglB family)
MTQTSVSTSTGSAPAGRASRLDLALAALLSQTPDLLAASVVSFDGLPMASALPIGMDEDRVAAMSAALLSLGERAAHGLGRGELSQVYVEGEHGSVFLVSADDEAVLVAVSTKQAKIGLMLFEVKRAAESVAAILAQEELIHAQEQVVQAQQHLAHAQQQASQQAQATASQATSVTSSTTHEGTTVHVPTGSSDASGDVTSADIGTSPSAQTDADQPLTESTSAHEPAFDPREISASTWA